MTVKIVAAMGKNRVIGRKGGGMPWGRSLKADLAHFKGLTFGHAVLMGRKTFTDDVKRPLPGRTNIILTRDLAFAADGCKVALSAHEVHWHVGSGQDLFVIGGGEVFRQFLNVAEEIHLTAIDQEFDGDVHFPDPARIPGSPFILYSSDRHEQDSDNTYAFTWQHWIRR